MAKKISHYNSVFARAWLRDNKTNTVYTTDGLLIAVVAHTHGRGRNGLQGKVLRTLMQDINENN